MSDESSLSLQGLVAPAGIDFDLHPELLGEKGMEKEIVVSLEIFNPDPFPIQTLKLMKHGEIVSKSQNLIGWGKLSKTKKELEEVAKYHQMAKPLFLQIEEFDKDLYRLRVSSGEMGIGNKNPILDRPIQCQSSPSNAAVIKP